MLHEEVMRALEKEMQAKDPRVSSGKGLHCLKRLSLDPLPALILEQALQDRIGTIDRWQQAGLPDHCYPRFYRGLPRCRSWPDLPARDFASFPLLLASLLQKGLVSLYDSLRQTKPARIKLFTHVLEDGWGDLASQRLLLRLLRRSFPACSIEGVALAKEPGKAPEGEAILLLPRDTDSSAIAAHLEDADLIIQAPTHYPKWHEVASRLLPSSRIERIGEYGFVHSSHFHPATGAYSLGLHALEKGIWIHPPARPVPPFWRKEWKEPGRYHFAYLLSCEGSTLFLQLLAHRERDSLKDILLLVPSLHPVLKALERGISLPGVKRVEILGDGIAASQGELGGKKLRIIELSRLGEQPFRQFLAAAEPLVACRGDHSFSEAISEKKLFFYDAPRHAEPFLLDLAALVRKEIGEGSLLQRWVDGQLLARSDGEAAFAQMVPLLDDPKLLLQTEQLAQLLRERFSLEPWLRSTVKRALYLQQRPDLVEAEAELFKKFLTKKLSLRRLVDATKVLLL